MAFKYYELLTQVNFTYLPHKTNKYIVIHYTGNSTDKAKSNADYFHTENRGASAHYFVDDENVYQIVRDTDSAWAIGVDYSHGHSPLFGKVNNNNSISIEMCSSNSKISDKTFENTIQLTKQLMEKYNIPVENVYRHYDVCGKVCPGWSGWGTKPKDNGNYWLKFKAMLKASEDMTKEEVKKIVEETIKENTKIYDWTTACPKWAIPTVQKLLDKGYLKGNDKGELGLTEEMLKIFVVNDRAGLYK